MDFFVNNREGGTREQKFPKEFASKTHRLADG